MPRKSSEKEQKIARLRAYREKRRPGATPEPTGGGELERPGLFVVQQHAARNLHYDLRLEIGGVLASWAVPKGPSLDPHEKRLAVATEDHPIEYADFEGVIPPGNYGAGAMIVWDRGRAVHHLDPEEGLEEGKLLFELHGYKLHGLWTLVQTKKQGQKTQEWLWIKKPDGFARDDKEDLAPESVLSGLTVQELAEGSETAERLRQELEELEAPERPVRLEKVRPMLAQFREEPFTREGWLFELKYDGYRILAGKTEDGRVKLRTRNGKDATKSFPEIVRTLHSLPFSELVLDGEMTVLDTEGRPDFSRLQRRALRTNPRQVEQATLELPAAYFVFDLLALEGFDLRLLPLETRKRLLREILPSAGAVRFADHVEERGEDLYALIRERNLEGILAKKADSIYRAGRSPSWLKIRSGHVGDFAVVGFERKGSVLDSLHLAVREGEDWRYVGKVGSGFTERQRAELPELLEDDQVDACPLKTSARWTRAKKHVWLEPRAVAEVRYTELTRSGRLRHPVFLSLRDDKTPEECLRETETPTGDREPPEVIEEPQVTEAPKLRLTRREKVFWPEEGYTKGDLLDYYEAIAPAMLPFLEDRPLVLDRYPDGIAGKSFFQKDAPDHVPGWVRTESVWSKDSSKETRYFVCDDVETLLYLVNLGTIPFHVGSSRIGSLEKPDWTILDLDAKDAPFEHVVKVAQTIHRLSKQIGWPAYVKTSGATGLHVLLPLGGRATHEQSRQLAELLARVVVSQEPEIASIARLPGARKGKVYVDFLQNGSGKLLVAPYAVRPLAGAPVSIPLTWREVTGKLDPQRFTIDTVPGRVKRKRKDPLLPVLGAGPDLTEVLGRLGEWV